MAYCHKYERSLFSFEEFDAIRSSHHPYIYDLDMSALAETRSHLRDMRAKERTLARQKRREVRGKAAPRGDSFPGTAEHPLKRKQVIGAALRRVNKEIKRQSKIEAKDAHVAAAKRALAMVRASKFRHHPEADKSGKEGMNPLPNRRRAWTVHGAQIGSVTKATKTAQAARDAKGQRDRGSAWLMSGRG